jgi:integrase
MAIKVLLGTGMRLSELCGPIVEDFENDGVRAFLKVRHGKGAKVRRVPVTSRLRREVVRYLNRWLSASRARLASFSLASSGLRATSHSSRDATCRRFLVTSLLRM